LTVETELPASSGPTETLQQMVSGPSSKNPFSTRGQSSGEAIDLSSGDIVDMDDETSPQISEISVTVPGSTSESALTPLIRGEMWAAKTSTDWQPPTEEITMSATAASSQLGVPTTQRVSEEEGFMTVPGDIPHSALARARAEGGARPPTPVPPTRTKGPDDDVQTSDDDLIPTGENTSLDFLENTYTRPGDDSTSRAAPPMRAEQQSLTDIDSLEEVMVADEFVDVVEDDAKTEDLKNEPSVTRSLPPPRT
jgi:hypothetical protein